MPRIRYPEVISETVDELQQRERALRGQATQARVQLLRLLKSGQVRSLVAAAPLVGYGERTVNRWWKCYQTDGLEALVATKPRRGPRSRLSAAAWDDLAAAMRRGEIATLRDAQHYLQEHHQLSYSLNGIWWQLRGRRARKKTGRRRHRQANAQAQQAYKRALRGQAAGGGVSAGVGL